MISRKPANRRAGEATKQFPLDLRKAVVNYSGMGRELNHSDHNRFFGFAALLNEAGAPASTGYRLRGKGRGPHLAVIGPATLVDAVHKRLMAISGLPDIHGVISLRRSEDDSVSSPDWWSVIYDDVLDLTLDDPDMNVAAEMASLQVLRRCTRLGMFAEHGSANPCSVA